MKHKKMRRVFRARVIRTNHHIVLVQFSDPLMKVLATTLLPPGAWIARTEGGTETWVYRSREYQPPISYCDTSGEPLITLRSIPENSEDYGG